MVAISGLTELTLSANTDLLVIVDGGTVTKKIQLSNLFAAGDLIAGQDDATPGNLRIFGGGAGELSGRMFLYNNADDDTNTNYWLFEGEDGTGDLTIETSGGTVAIRCDDSTGYVTLVNEANTEEYRDNTADKYLTTDAVWGAMAEVSLSDGANIAWDMSSGIDFTVTLGGNRHLDNPTNTQVGKKGRIRVVQDGSGSRTLIFGTNFEFAGGTNTAMSTANNAEDILYYDCISSSRILITSVLDIS